MNNKILTLLGFAAKSGNLSYGFEATITSLKRGKSQLIVVASDISPKSIKEIAFFAEKFGVKHIILESIDIKAVSDAVGRKCGIISVNDKGFANSCVNAILGGNANDKQI